MNGKRYYLTTLGAWQRHTHRFTNSHFIVLAQTPAPATEGIPDANSDPGIAAPAVAARQQTRDGQTLPHDGLVAARQARSATPEDSSANPGEGNCPTTGVPLAATPILVLVEGDEGAHLALEDEAAFEPLPHPLAQKPISGAAQAALAPHGVAPGATTFDAAEALARVHPLLRHRVF